MYTLRIIEEIRADEKSPFSQITRNISLGDSYILVCRGHSPLFDEEVKDYPEHVIDKIRAVILYGAGKSYPIQSNEPNNVASYYIMTETGKTFERL